MKSFAEMIEQSSTKYAKKDQYLKITDGQSVEGAFVGGVLPFYRVYGDLTRYEHKTSPQATFKVGTTFALCPDMTPKALEMGAKLWGQVKTAIKNHGQNSIFKIRRIGSEKQTIYVLDFVRPLTETEVTNLNRVEPFEFSYTNLESKPVTRGEDKDPESHVQTPSIVEDDIDFT